MKKTISHILLPVFIFSLPITWAMAQSTDSDFKRMRQRINQRYEDFFEHEQRQKRFDTKRRKGASAVEKQRKAEQVAKEKARERYIRNRKAKPGTAALEKAWEAKQARLERERLKKEENYAEQRKRIQRMEATSKQIPPEIESGLIPQY